ncbi:MAG TPA: hypothetical protein VK459_23185 [Polyangiaceae bacterium]|nr:hypothetical protein [Polyangiaceae bacterium]
MSPVTLEALRRIAAVHGLLAWVSAALLAIATGLLARRRPVPRYTIAASALATAFTAIVSGLGMLLHEPYLSRLRQRIFVKDPALGWLFERKEHFAFGSLGLALGGLASLAVLVLVDRRLIRGTNVGPAPTSPVLIALRRAVLTAYIASTALALAACILSSLVARRFSF